MNLAKIIKKSLKGIIKDQGWQAAGEVFLEHPGGEGHGDYATNVALKLKAKSKEQKTATKNLKSKSPRELAEEMVGKLREDKELMKVVERVEVGGGGFINFFLRKERLVEELGEIIKSGEEYGAGSAWKGKKIMVEYAHPNTHKQFHVGHLRNIITGESIARLLEASGARVIRANYQGDVGLHVAKALWGIRKQIKNSHLAKALTSKHKLKINKVEGWSLDKKIEFLGKAYVTGSTAYEENREAKKEIVEINKALYKQSDEEIVRLWKLTRQWSLDYFEKIYKRIGTKFDRLYFESEVHALGKKIAEEALKKRILEKSEGAVVFNGKKYGLDTRVFLTREGLPTYEAKELGLAVLEFGEFGEIDGCIHVVAPEQTSFFKVTFKVEELWDAKKYQGKQHHLKYGFVDLKTGKMSSRKGVVVTGSSVIEEAKKKVSGILERGEFSNKEKEEIAEMVAGGAVKYSMLKYGTGKNIAFDLGESVSLEGNSGPYLQYTHARARSVLRKAKIRDQGSKTRTNDQEVTLNTEELRVLRWVYRFPEVVEEAARDYAPNLVGNFLYELAQRFNSFYNKHMILTAREGEETVRFRLLLTVATAQVLKNGLYLLGIEAPERM